jgi:ATP-dependent DNA helicase PIF1
MGLHAHLLLAIGARVMLRSNLWTAHGLTNGALGTVIAIVYTPGTHPAAGDLPVAVVVDFDQYTGPPLRPGTRHVAVPAITVFSETLKNHQTRQQVPLQLGFATTIHKSQGLTVGPGETLTHMTVDLGDREFAIGLTYVACSRAKALDCLAFRPAPILERFVRPHVPKQLKQRLHHDQQQRLAAANTRRVFAHLADRLYDPTLDDLLHSVSHS